MIVRESKMKKNIKREKGRKRRKEGRKTVGQMLSVMIIVMI